MKKIINIILFSVGLMVSSLYVMGCSSSIDVEEQELTEENTSNARSIFSEHHGSDTIGHSISDYSSSAHDSHHNAHTGKHGHHKDWEKSRKN